MVNKIRYKSNFFEKIIYFLLYFFYVFAILPEEIFALISVLICAYLLISNKIKFNFFNIGILAISLINLISSLFFLVVYPETDLLRFLSSLNTILTRVAPALIIFNNSYRVTLIKNRIVKAAEINLMVVFILSLIGIVFMKLNINVSFLGSNLLMDDYINGVRTQRLSLFFEYASLITFFVFINFGLLFLFSKKYKTNFLLLLISFLPIYYSNSRICIVAYIVLALFYAFNYLIKHFPNFTKIFIFLILFFAVAICLFSFDSIQQIINDILNLRSGSNTLRFRVYADSLGLTFQTNPLFGCGIKISYTDVVPYGSHSTFIGMIYKTGIIGFVLFLILYFYVFSRLIGKRNWVGVGMFFAFSLIMVFEDIDGKNWQMFYLLLLTFFALSPRTSKNVKVIRLKQVESRI